MKYSFELYMEDIIICDNYDDPENMSLILKVTSPDSNNNFINKILKINDLETLINMLNVAKNVLFQKE